MESTETNQREAMSTTRQQREKPKEQKNKEGGVCEKRRPRDVPKGEKVGEKRAPPQEKINIQRERRQKSEPRIISPWPV